MLISLFSWVLTLLLRLLQVLLLLLLLLLLDAGLLQSIWWEQHLVLPLQLPLLLLTVWLLTIHLNLQGVLQQRRRQQLLLLLLILLPAPLLLLLLLPHQKPLFTLGQ
jgi:hypothetical protein